jgi:hypothetical protein
LHRPICRCGGGFVRSITSLRPSRVYPAANWGVALGVKQTTAWKIKHKLKQVMLERDATKLLTEMIEIGDASRRRTLWRKARLRGAWQDAVRCSRRDDHRGKAGSPEAAPGHQLLCNLARGVRQAQPRSKLLCRQRRSSVFRQRRRSWLCAPSRRDRVGTKGSSDAGLQMGQHGPRQHQGRHHRNIPCHQQPACRALPRRIRIPLQPTIRFGPHDPARHLGRRPNTPMPYGLVKLAEVYA